MTPRQFGHRDYSTDGRVGAGGWACPDCPYRHAPGSACPRPGQWLVLALCPACTGRYCPAHRGRTTP